jgi:hypothetical protein
MKRSQLRQIIRQIINEQGVSDNTPQPFITPGPNESPCCNAIQQLKPYIPVSKKTAYLKALDDCGCNAPNTGPTPSDPLPFVTPDN